MNDLKNLEHKSVENKRQSNQFDTHISRRLRSLRRSLGLSQKDLAEMMEVTYQQAHKYERNVNRIPAGRLGMLANKLNVPVQYFYEGLGSDSVESGETAKESMPPLGSDEVLQHFRSIENGRQREALRYLIRSLAEK